MVPPWDQTGIGWEPRPGSYSEEGPLVLIQLAWLALLSPALLVSPLSSLITLRAPW
jgi:hypothetical protein